MNLQFLINRYQKEGFNKSQATSIAWTEILERAQVEVEYRSQGLSTKVIRIDTYCADCKEGGQFLPDTTRAFIFRHKDHKTKTIKLR